jgi:hypothetical protein
VRLRFNEFGYNYSMYADKVPKKCSNLQAELVSLLRASMSVTGSVKCTLNALQRFFKMAVTGASLSILFTLLNITSFGVLNDRQSY